MKWTEERVAMAIARTLFDWKRNVVVPNLSWGMGLGFEIDLGVLTTADWLTEVEIKVSVADLRQDAKKWRHQVEKHTGVESVIRRKFFALPYDVDVKRVAAGVTIPPDCGLIVVRGDGMGRDAATIVREAPTRANSRKLRADEREQMIRLGYIRFWAQRDASALAQAGLTRAFEEHITRAAAA